MQGLIVEDDVRLAQALAHILAENGYQTDVVHDGASGLAYAECGDYDVIILDVMLPKMDGFAVVAQLRRKSISVPVLLLTARELEKLRRASQDRGLTIVGLRLFLNDRGLAKVVVGLARGRKSYDKREYLTENDAKREMDKAMKNYSR